MPPSRGHGAGDSDNTTPIVARRSSQGIVTPPVAATDPPSVSRRPHTRQAHAAHARRQPSGGRHNSPSSAILFHPHVVVLTVLALVLALTCTPVLGAPVTLTSASGGDNSDGNASVDRNGNSIRNTAITSESHTDVSEGGVHVTDPAPQVIEVQVGSARSTRSSSNAEAQSQYKAGSHPNLHLDSSSSSTSSSNRGTPSPPPPQMNSGDSATEAAIRAAFAAVVDPVGSWFLDEPSSGSQTGWGSHFSLLFGFGGEGSMNVVFDYATGGQANVSLPHRPAAFPAFLPPDSDLPVSGTLVTFASLPPPNSTKFAAIGADSAVGGQVPNPDFSSRESWNEPPERACVPRAWPPVRPSIPSEPYVIALVERGGCDFATKVRAAQERGVAAVVVGDKKLREGETDEEGRHRESLLTMFSPEDTSGIIIPSIFVSRASYLLLRDLLKNQTVDGRSGVKVEIGPAEDDGSALGSLLTFALLMPTLFLLATVTAHRVRVARQREANRAPPTVVLSLPERVWTPDIVWEKDSDESDKDEEASPAAESNNLEGNNVEANKDAVETNDAGDGNATVQPTNSRKMSDSSDVAVVESSDAALADHEGEGTDTAAESHLHQQTAKKARKRDKTRRKSRSKRYYSKDECAICMDNFHRGEIVRILPCGHVFHKDECDEWLLKWRKLCPTCRADVTIAPGDLSGSATLTPVVDPEAAAAAAAGLGIEGDDDTGTSWRQRLQSGISAAALAVGDSFRAAVGRPPANSAGAVVAPPRPRTANLPSAADERTPLLGP